MLVERAYLAIRLEGPMQAWGFDSQFDIRNTGFIPTKSAIVGMICAAKGFSRGSKQESELLEELTEMKLLTIQIPRQARIGGQKLDVRRMQDYQTVQGTVKASGGIKQTHLTTRYYLNDASFGAVIEGYKLLLENIASALKNPVWGLWLGRKNCIPTAPVYAGLYLSENEAFKILTDGKSGKYRCQREVSDFVSGVDSLSDQIVSFESATRTFTPRRVRQEWINV